MMKLMLKPNKHLSYDEFLEEMEKRKNNAKIDINSDKTEAESDVKWDLKEEAKKE